MKESQDIKTQENEGRVYNLGNEQILIHTGEQVWKFQTEKGERKIPVLSVWDYDNHDKIAQTIAGGRRIAMYMWGTYGTGYLLNFPEWQNKQSEEARDLRENLKIGRPKDQSFPTLIHPDDQWMFWDFDELHSNLRFLRDANQRHQLYNSGPVHIIAPRKENSYLDESLKWPTDNTACFYYMPHPAWERVINKIRKNTKHAVFAGGSLNMHKKDPVFTTEDLKRRIAEIPNWANTIDLVVTCEISEHSHSFRSQTQIRLAQKNTDGVSEVVRQGSLLPQRWSKEQDISIKTAQEGLKFASSQTEYSEEENLKIDQKIQKTIEQMRLFDREFAKKLSK